MIQFRLSDILIIFHETGQGGRQALALVLLVTLGLNFIALSVVKRYREAYD